MPEQIAYVIIGAFVSAVFFILINRKDRHSTPCQALGIIEARMNELSNTINKNSGKIEANERSIGKVTVAQGRLETEISNVKELLLRIDGKLDKAIEIKTKA